MDPFGNPHGSWSGGLHHQDGTNSNNTTDSYRNSSDAKTAPMQQTQQAAEAQQLSRPPPPGQPALQVCAEVKPRLTKEQHDILERHFQQQPKPSTNVKKGFAEVLGVPLDKINVSFVTLASSPVGVLTSSPF